MKVTAVNDYSWLYTLLNNNASRATTAAAQSGTTSQQQVNGVTNIDGDSFVASGAGQTGGGQPVGANDDGSALDLRSFLDKVKNGTVTQDDLDAMKEKLSRFQQNAGAMPPPPPQGTGGAGDRIKTFLDKVAAGTVTDTDLTDMQTWLSQLPQPAGDATATSAAADGTTSYGQTTANLLFAAYSKTGKNS